MTSAAVFARANGKELFLGHSRAASTRPEALLMDLIGGLSGTRAALWAELQRRGEVRLDAIPVLDIWADLSWANRYIHPDTGKPFLRQHPLDALAFTSATAAQTPCAVAYWEELVFATRTGRRDDIGLTADYEVPFTLQDGTASDMELGS
jgi:hypothetical protein